MTPKPETVRVATGADEEAVFSLLTMAHRENGFARLDEAKVRAHIQMGTRQKGRIIGVIDGPDGLEGLLFLILARYWYSDDWHLEDLGNFVRPDRRRSEHAKHLLQFGKWAAEDMGLPLFIGILTNDRVEAKVRLYQRQLAYGGAVFHHNLKREEAHG